MAKAVSKKDLFTKKLGKHIAKLRREAGLNQSELASLCDKDRQSIQRLESGGMNPTAYYLTEIAIALKVPVKELLNFE